MPPRVSVVVPSYNNGDFIEATMDSILAQTFTDFELIVADHCSTDDTWDKLQPYAADPRVTLLQTEAGGGTVRNWTRVTREAKAPLLKLVCGDDLIYLTCLEEQVGVMDIDPSVGLVACRRDIIDARGAVIIRGRGLAGLKGRVAGRQAVRAAVLAGANIFGEPGCVLIRRELHERAGGWDDTHPYLIDEASYVNVLLETDFYALDRSLAGFRLSAGQWSVNLARQQAAQAVGFHRALARRAPSLLSRTDLVRGNTMARALAFTRRLAYLWVGRRMHADS